MSDGKFCCPDCGSENAVSKAVAWDALTEIPPKVKDDIDRLRRIEMAARLLVSDSPKTPDQETVCITVSRDHFELLATAMD